MREDRSVWEKRHAAADDSAGTPSSFLVEHADQIRGRILDVACGRGRNSLFLARRGNLVEGIDIAFAGLLSLRRHAAMEGLRVNLIQADLDDFPLPTARYDAVLNIRYLNRDLFPALVHALKPGGLLLFETFLIDQQKIGHPSNANFLLRRGELRDAFASTEILRDEEGLFDVADGKAYLARLLARRRSA